MFNSLESRKGSVHLLNGSSYAIEGVRTISLKAYNGIARKLSEVQYISNFSKNLILLSKQDLNGYT